MTTISPLVSGLRFAQTLAAPKTQASQPLPSASDSVQFGQKKADAKTPKITYELERTIKDPVVGDIEVYRFSDGMELYALKKEDVPLVSYGVLVKTGANNEPAKPMAPPTS